MDDNCIVSPYATYTKLEKLGGGAYGVVYKAQNRGSGELVAIKKMSLTESANGVGSTVMREVAILQQLSRHENIVKVIDFFPKADKMYLVLELMDTNLKQIMRKNDKPSDATIKSYMHQMMKGVAFCHANRIIHRDLKPENILIDHSGNLKLGDFGTARTLTKPERRYTAEVCTIWYRAPEILLGNGVYSMPVDIWAAAAIFAEMLCYGRPLFPGDSEIDQTMRIFRLLGTPTEEIWPGVTALPFWKPHFPNWEPRSLTRHLSTTDIHAIDAIDLLSKMLLYDPSQRVTAKGALLSAYFENH